MAAERDWKALLQAGDVEAFNGARTERTRLELFAEDFSEVTLAGIDLTNATLEKSDFTGADLTDATLVKANLSGIDGSGIVLRDALALRSRWKDAWMDEADLAGADFTEADLADANLERSTGAGVRFVKARLRGVKAAGACWPGADLTGAKLHAAALAGADLRNADLSDATFGEADLTGARLDGARGGGAKFGKAKLAAAGLGRAVLPNASFDECDLTGADLSAADLSRANLTRANLTNARLAGAVLADANLEGAILVGADLTGADLSGVDVRGLGLSDAAIAGLSGHGVTDDAQAPLVFSDVSVARAGEVVALVWPNPEGEPPPPPEVAEGEEPPPPEEPRTWRFLLVAGERRVVGVLPVPGNTVLDGQIVSFKGAFKVVLTRARPEGAALVTATLGLDGVLGPARSVPLGYDPAVQPVLRVEGERLRMYGLARTGPTLVVHDLTEVEPAPVRSDRQPTARGFLGQPVLSCKGGVVVPLAKTGPGAPRQTPDGFPGTMAVALPFGDDVVAVWAIDKVGRTPGGVRVARIGKRHAPTADELDTRARVIGLAALPEPPTPDGDPAARAWWLVADERAGRIQLFTAALPDGDVVALPGPADALELSAGPGVLALARAEGGLLLLTAEGRPLAEVSA